MRRGVSGSQCVSLHTDNFTEELLNLHEAEVLTLKKYYEDHRELFDGVTKWKENWTLFLELDVSDGPLWVVKIIKTAYTPACKMT